ncbi:flagellar motor protein MotB [Thermodesulfobacteriota bacterium]
MASDRTLRIILTGDLLFDLGKADLKPAAKRSLMKIAEIIQRSTYNVNVVGHTDSIPIHNERFDTNWELSLIRAAAVARFLTEELKISPRRFMVSGFSYFQPLRPNDSAENRALNRRVEIIISREPSEPFPGAFLGGGEE